VLVTDSTSPTPGAIYAVSVDGVGESPEYVTSSIV